MNGSAHGPDPLVREHLAKLVPAPIERDMPGDRHLVLREAYMQEIASTQPEGVLRSPRQRTRLAMAGSLVAAGAVAVSVFTGMIAATPAWAVETGPGDMITVRITEFSDPQGLEARLEAEGVPAIVDYVPADKGCSRGGRLETFPEIERGRVVSSARVENGATVFQFQRGDIGAGMELSIVALGTSGESEPVGFTLGLLPAPAQHCELTDTPTARR